MSRRKEAYAEFGDPRQVDLEEAIAGVDVQRDAELVRVQLNAKGRRQDERGRELPDPVPLAPPVGYKPSKDIFEQVREMVRSEALAAAAAAGGAETFEEAEDFNVGDDFDPSSPYEDVFEGMSVREMDERISELVALRNDRTAAERPGQDPARYSPPAPKAGATEAPGAPGDAPESAPVDGKGGK